jgi:hypothetical protein
MSVLNANALPRFVFSFIMYFLFRLVVSEVEKEPTQLRITRV